VKASEFCYWLQGYFEIAAKGEEVEPGWLHPPQTEVIKAHLAMVFKHELDQQHGTPEHQAELQSIHDTTKPQIGGIGPSGEVYRC
jgi:hypothetical protein